MIQHPAQKPSDSQSGNHFGGDPADQAAASAGRPARLLSCCFLSCSSSAASIRCLSLSSDSPEDFSEALFAPSDCREDFPEIAATPNTPKGYFGLAEIARKLWLAA